MFRKSCAKVFPFVFGGAGRGAQDLNLNNDVLFDTILASDVLYGADAEKTACELISTVAGLLHPSGCFLLGIRPRFFTDKQDVEGALARAASAAQLQLRVFGEPQRGDGVRLLELTWINLDELD
eukprot:gnl/MRDRNA2_/MRDRNA2_411742_c0_seq1.p1 gnl/MRDRNA2_/MRDRNA2_411742_c0~~gnl/MRDRNA2_/MRDRNA2_411742_c0_seq1.p1  ORF type:complete len:124 (+),score=10.57 gnl/MRDRNA2_/MRDRNA2_411742_c0_seq1:2-373(+)